jgi:phosphatidylserine/phosphatidylglycerophosphate/cardiolipin synthase-like enzyme
MRRHMRRLQHNKTIVIDGPKVQAVVCGSTNFTWRGFFVQSNNAIVLRGKDAVSPFLTAFDDYWENDADGFGKTASAKWTDLKLSGIDAKVAFSPHSSQNALLAKVAADIGTKTTSSLLYSLAFLCVE